MKYDSPSPVITVMEILHLYLYSNSSSEVSGHRFLYDSVSFLCFLVPLKTYALNFELSCIYF